MTRGAPPWTGSFDTTTGFPILPLNLRESTVSVASGRISDVKVTRHTEKQWYSSITDTRRQILLKQGAKGVDATSGATITSEAILNATLKALAKGQK